MVAYYLCFLYQIGFSTMFWSAERMVEVFTIIRRIMCHHWMFFGWTTQNNFYQWLVGLGVWFSLRVREVPGSNPGRALNIFFAFAHMWLHLVLLVKSQGFCSILKSFFAHDSLHRWSINGKQLLRTWNKASIPKMATPFCIYPINSWYHLEVGTIYRTVYRNLKNLCSEAPI